LTFARAALGAKMRSREAIHAIASREAGGTLVLLKGSSGTAIAPIT
jgi:hypothetical protein